MVGVARDEVADLQVARRADLEWNPELCDSLLDGGRLEQVDPVADSSGAEIDRFLDVLGAAVLARVEGDRDVRVVGEADGRPVDCRREAALRPGEVEADDSLPAELRRELRHFHRPLGRLVAKRGQQKVHLDAELVLRARASGHGRLHHVAR